MSEDQQPPDVRQVRQDATRDRAVVQAQGQRQPIRTAQVERQERAQENYQQVVAIMRDNKSAEARAIKAMLGGSEQAFQKYLATVFSLLATKSEVLEKATALSIVNAVKVAASMGLEPLTDDGGIVVYGDQATFMPQWQGYLKRIRNSGRVRDIDVQVAYEGDSFRYGTSQNGSWFIHEPTQDPAERGAFRYFYAYAVMPTGFVVLEVMTAAEVDAVRDQFAKGLDKKDQDGRFTSPWRTSYAEMGRKTVVRRLRKRLPQEATGGLEAAEQAAEALEASLAEVANQVAHQRQELLTLGDMARVAVGQLPAGPPAAPEGAQEGPGAAEASSEARSATRPE